jgi:hypothetical protein
MYIAVSAVANGGAVTDTTCYTRTKTTVATALVDAAALSIESGTTY